MGAVVNAPFDSPLGCALLNPSRWSCAKSRRCRRITVARMIGADEGHDTTSAEGAPMLESQIDGAGFRSFISMNACPSAPSMQFSAGFRSDDDDADGDGESVGIATAVSARFILDRTGDPLSKWISVCRRRHRAHNFDALATWRIVLKEFLRLHPLVVERMSIEKRLNRGSPCLPLPAPAANVPHVIVGNMLYVSGQISPTKKAAGRRSGTPAGRRYAVAGWRLLAQARAALGIAGPRQAGGAAGRFDARPRFHRPMRSSTAVRPDGGCSAQRPPCPRCGVRPRPAARRRGRDRRHRARSFDGTASDFIPADRASRAAPHRLPENSMAAFRAAIANGWRHRNVTSSAPWTVHRWCFTTMNWARRPARTNGTVAASTPAAWCGRGCWARDG